MGEIDSNHRWWCARIGERTENMKDDRIECVLERGDERGMGWEGVNRGT